MACPLNLTLNNGAKMPLLGYGTWQAGEGELEKALELALTAGYRLIDTAVVYENEAVIGKVLKEQWLDTGDLSRDDLFLTSKLPPGRMRAEDVEASLCQTLSDLRTGYLDLYLIHIPMGFQGGGHPMYPKGEDGLVINDPTTDHVAIWKAMEEQVDAGRVRAIGLSNFNRRQIQRILDHCRIRPANLQVELHVYMQQRPLVEFCRQNDLTVTAYSPLGSRGTPTFFGLQEEYPDLITNPVVLEVAAAHNVTPAQVLLKHILQRGIAAIPKSTNQERIEQNIQLFHFELTPDEVCKLDDLDRGNNGRIINFSFIKGCENHPEYPF